MNPDAIIAALRQELETCKDPERKKAIREEINATDGLERPAIITETAQLEVVDFDRAYLDGLRQELERSGKERQKEIKTEIARVEATLKEEPVSEQPSEQEIEQRRQARTDQGVEQARSAPLPGQAPPAETAPEQGAKEKSTNE